jgi:hypothetical protein
MAFLSEKQTLERRCHISDILKRLCFLKSVLFISVSSLDMFYKKYVFRKKK